MPFETTTLVDATNVPDGVPYYLPSDVALGDRSPATVAQSNLDASGGAMAFDDATSTWTYTAQDGTQTSAVIGLPDGYDVQTSLYNRGYDGKPVVFGNDLDKFVLKIELASYDDIPEDGISVGLMTVGLNDDGVPELLEVDTHIDGMDVFPGGIVKTFGIYPMGDGRLGYFAYSTGLDYDDEWGVLSESDEGVDGVDRLELASGYGFAPYSSPPDIRYLAGPDGAIVNVRNSGDDDDDSIPVTTGVSTRVLTEDGTFEFDSIRLEGLPETGILFDRTEDGDILVYVREGTEPDDDYVLQQVVDIAPFASDEGDVSVTATEVDDILTLTDADDVIDALGGNDTVFGGDGDDHLIGGKGFDILNGGAGNDALFGGNSKDELFGEVGDDDLYGGAGLDILNGGDDNDELYGGKGNDTVVGGAGEDRLEGGEHHDSLYGDDGDDQLIGGKGFDLLNGGSGDDILFGGNSKDELFGEVGDDVLFGGAGRDILNGGDGNDELFGGKGDDTVLGGAGDDLLIGGSGSDALTGGNGADLFQFETAHVEDINLIGDFIIGEDIVVILDAEIDLTFEDLTLSQEENVAVIQVGEVMIRLEGVDAEDLSAADFQFGGKISETVIGGAGDDVLIGGDAGDYLVGGAGNDILEGGAGDDDIISVDIFATPVQTGGLYGGEGDDTLYGGDGRDALYGEDGDDFLYGGAGNDDRVPNSIMDGGLYGGDGDDFIRGEAGNDDLSGGWGNDDIDGGLGDDFADGGGGDDQVSGFDGRDNLRGNLGNDTVNGGRGDDRLSGGDGDDTLLGGEGEDHLSGNLGNDVMTGGKGDDRFIFRTYNNDGTDTIEDFTTGEDLIQISTGGSELTYDDIFLSQEDSVAVIQTAEMTIRLQNVDVDDLSEDDFLLHG